MITIQQIRGTSDYLGNHLSANDYYSEGESVTGYWHGKLAEKLGLAGKAVNQQDFESLRDNRHPETGEKLRPRVAAVKFHDVVVSAPKSYSIAALVGSDEELVEGFTRAAEKARVRLERVVEVRNRQGAAVQTENTVRTGNAAVAVFQHDSSRLLEPQLHSHLVFSNLSFSVERGEYLALQPKAMMDEAKRWITDQFHRDLAKEALGAGYEVEFKNGRMRLKCISPQLEEKFSTRAQQRIAFENRYQKLFGQKPSKKRIEQFIKQGKSDAKKHFKNEYHARFGSWPSAQIEKEFVKDWRSAKMARSTRDKVFQSQREKLTAREADLLDRQVERAREYRSEQQGNHAEQEHGEGTSHSVEQKTVEEVKENRRRQTDSASEREVIKKRKRASEEFQRSVGRIEAIRRMRRGMAVARALQGHPAIFMIQQLTNLRRQSR